MSNDGNRGAPGNPGNRSITHRVASAAKATQSQPQPKSKLGQVPARAQVGAPRTTSASWLSRVPSKGESPASNKPRSKLGQVPSVAQAQQKPGDGEKPAQKPDEAPGTKPAVEPRKPTILPQDPKKPSTQPGTRPPGTFPKPPASGGDTTSTTGGGSTGQPVKADDRKNAPKFY